MQSRKVALAIALAGVLIAWALYTSMGGTFSLAWLGGTTGHPGAVRPVAATDHMYGNPAAPAIIVTYCDFESPYCKSFTQVLNELVATDGANGQVAWVYREFPLHESTGNALSDARAAECAGLAGGESGFWAFAGQLFAAQPADPTHYGMLAAAAELPTDAFASCYASAASKVDARIKADRENALAVGADGAPYSILIVKGKAPQVLDGAYPFDQLRQVVADALGQQN